MLSDSVSQLNHPRRLLGCCCAAYRDDPMVAQKAAATFFLGWPRYVAIAICVLSPCYALSGSCVDILGVLSERNFRYAGSD